MSAQGIARREVTGPHTHAWVGVASSCVCCKPVAEGGAGVGLRLLRGARKRNIIRHRDQEERRSSPVLPLMRGRGGRPFPLTHETRCLAGGGWGGPVWSLVLVGECGTPTRRRSAHPTKRNSVPAVGNLHVVAIPQGRSEH
jgi:hypothetical protein